MESWTSSELIFKGKIFSVRTGTVRLENGLSAYREVVEHPGGVCVLPWTGRSVILVRQFRIALAEDIIEAPAGKLEGPNDDPQARGRVELEEEVGYRAEHMISAGVIYGTVGFCSEKIHLFVASGLTPVLVVAGDVDAERQAARIDGREVLAQEGFGLVADVEVHVIQPALLHFEVDRARHHVARS